MHLLRPTHLCIDLKQLQRNFIALKKLTSPNTFFCPMIKANAYGHGDGPVARALVQVGCEQVGVACVEEALFVKQYTQEVKILVFGFCGRDAALEIGEQGFIPVISDFEQIEHLTTCVKKPLPVHIKLNTGMNRLGFSESELARLSACLKAQPLLQVVGIGTHLYSGGDWDLGADSTAYMQQRQFIDWVKKLDLTASKVHQHLYNSAAITARYLLGESLDYGLRPGLLVYGVDPSLDLSMGPLIGPVMSYKSKIVAQQQVQSGQVVSYGGTWTAPRDSRIAVVPAGYGDGLARSLSNHGYVLVNGQRCPIRGRVCMDYTMVDVTDLPKRDSVGDEVVFVGRQGQESISVNQVSQWAQRVNYEVMTSISERVPRHYTGDEFDS